MVSKLAKTIIIYVIINIIVCFLFIYAVKIWQEQINIYQGVDNMVIKTNILDDMNNNYISYGSKEYVFCLQGELEDGKVFITDYYKPIIINSTRSCVNYIGCSKVNTIGTIHSHPAGNCVLSDKDIYTFGKQSSFVVEMVQCGTDNFKLYTPESLKIPVKFDEE